MIRYDGNRQEHSRRTGTAGLNQKELAERTGVSGCYISQIISGKLAPSLKMLDKLSVALGSSTAELLEECEPKVRQRRVG